MSAYSSIYTSLTGLLGFSGALNVISDNVANLNTPGFKASDVLFRDLGPKANAESGNRDSFGNSTGDGVEFLGTQRRFTQGDFQSSGNATDLLIDGNGFFVLKEGKQQWYSRAGQFTFDEAGYLVDSVSRARVQGIDAGNVVADVRIDPDAVNPPVPTTKVSLTGLLVPAIANYTLSDVSVIDGAGKAHNLSMAFVYDTASQNGFNWAVTVRDGADQLFQGTVSYNGDGTPKAPNNQVTVKIKSDNNEEREVVIDFGAEGSTDGTRSLSAATTANGLTVGENDGIPVGVLTGVVVDREGLVQLSYSNGKTSTGPQIAIANFSNLQSLLSIGSSRFESKELPQYGRPAEGASGALRSGGIELANVDLSQEFANIIVLQRAFQGSSQVLNISSQMLDQLYNNLGGR